jgi:hypothetical protein
MKRTNLPLIGATLLVLAGVAFTGVQVQAAPGGSPAAAPDWQVTALPSATPTLLLPLENATETPGALTPGRSMVEEWDRVCVKKVPYTILAIPETATFSVVAPDGLIEPTLEPGTINPEANACQSVLVFDGKQIIVCSGPQDTTITMRVTNGGLTEDFDVPFKVCPLKPEPKNPPTTPLVVPSETPVIPPTP